MSVSWFSFILSLCFLLLYFFYPPFLCCYLFLFLLFLHFSCFTPFLSFFPYSLLFNFYHSCFYLPLLSSFCLFISPHSTFHISSSFFTFLFFPLTILSISFILPVSFFRHFWLTVMLTPIQKLSAISGVSEEGHIIMTYEPDLASQYREQPGAKYLGWGHTAKTAVDAFKIMGHPNCWIWTNSVYISSPDFQKPNVNKSKSTLRKLQKHTFFKRRSWRNTHAHTSLQHLSCIFIY